MKALLAMSVEERRRQRLRQSVAATSRLLQDKAAKKKNEEVDDLDFATYDKLNAAHAAKKRTKAAQLPAKAVSIEPVATTTTATTTTNGDGDSDGQLWLRALVGEPNGQRVLRAEQQGSAEHPETLGIAVAEQLLKQGAGDILAAVYGDSAQ